MTNRQAAIEEATRGMVNGGGTKMLVEIPRAAELRQARIEHPKEMKRQERNFWEHQFLGELKDKLRGDPEWERALGLYIKEQRLRVDAGEYGRS